MARDDLPVTGTLSDLARVTIDEIEIGHLTQLAGWSNFEAAAERLLQTLGVVLPADYRMPARTYHTPVRAGATTVWRVAPDRVLVHSAAELGLASSPDVAVLDLSQARVCLSVTGPGAAALLSRVVALDFSGTAFPTGTFAQTGLHHVGVLIERTGRETFLVFIPTTWARSLTELLIDHLLVAA